MSRRSFVRLALASTFATASGSWTPADAQAASRQNDADLRARWERLDNTIRGWWSGDRHRATEQEIRQDPGNNLLFLPFPYSTAGGSEPAFPEEYGWDTQFTNLGLLAHGRSEIVRDNMLDQLFMIERYGMVLNGNRIYYLTRGQPPLLAWSVENYLAVKSDDDELAMFAYPNLERAYKSYWDGASHLTPVGLSTCHDSGHGVIGTDAVVHGAIAGRAVDNAPSDLVSGNVGAETEQELAAECESGLDFTPIFGGHVHQCVPIHINCALVRQARVLSGLAKRFGWHDKASHWDSVADARAQLINQYCWDDEKGCYLEYNFVRGKRLPYYSLNMFWPLWAGIASPAQAERVKDHLALFDFPFGLSFTDTDYPNPHPQFKALEWAYPESWPPQQIIAAMALRRYGFHDEARMINLRYITNVVNTFEKTGSTWERYNAVVGGHNCPVERTPVAKLHGWSSSSAVVLGRMLFGPEEPARDDRQSNPGPAKAALPQMRMRFSTWKREQS
ncbi:MAG: trehalase family glycosidase [Acidobacteriaceae bacterium]